MTAATADNPLPPGIVAALYLRTRTLHVEAERTGIFRDLLRGEASRDGYVLLLRNLHPAYVAMEQALERHHGSAHLAPLAAYRLDRAAAIEADLVELCGECWSEHIPLLAAAELYAERIAMAAEGHGARLLAHAYTRYLGDFSGGQILQRLLARSLGLRRRELSFYDFPRFSDLDALKIDYRTMLDRVGALLPDRDSIVEEGAAAFSCNIALSRSVQAAVTRGSAAAI